MSQRAIPVARDCDHCKRTFLTKSRGEPRYCGARCVWEVTKGPEFNARISRETAKARGDAKRDPPGATYYRKVNGRHEHRVVAEAMLGRALEPWEIVHHRDHDKRNNHPSNLEVMSRAAHARVHSPERFR